MAIILIAGATGNLGQRIIDSLQTKGASVRALVRSSSDPKTIAKLKEQGIDVIEISDWNEDELKQACNGVSCVVSALQGLGEVIIDAQLILLNAAVAAGVTHFIPSDFSCDFTRLPAGENRNFDLRREFHSYLENAPIHFTSIFNGAFAEILTYNIPILDYKKKTVGYWGDNADWKLDFTTMNDTAAFTAEAAMDADAPKKLCIASFQICPAELAALASDTSKTPYQLVRMGSVEDLAAYNKRERAAHPEGEKELYPRWQSSQYIQSMFTVQNTNSDNNRYPNLQWATAADVLKNVPL